MRYFALACVAAAALVIGLCIAAGGGHELMAMNPHGIAGNVTMAMGLMVPASSSARGILSVRAEGDVAGLIRSLNSDFESFKAAMAEKDKELAKKFDDVVTTEKIDRINSSVGELQKLVDDANAKIAAMSMSAGGSIEVKDKEYTDAFRAHFRKGDVQASLNKGAADEGGYLAPVEWDRTITDKLVQVSPMRQIASVQTISTAGFTKLFNLRGTASGWVGETAARPQTNTPTFGSMTFSTGEIYANPAATQQMLDDAAINLDQWLAGEVEGEFAYQEGLAFLSGDGTNKPRGLLTFVTGGTAAAVNPLGAIQLKMAAAAAAIDKDELVDLVYMLPAAFTQEARFIMNRTVQGTIRKLKDGDGNYLWQPSYVAGQPATLLGYPVTEMPGMPNLAANALPIAFGDFRRGYLIVDRVGIRVLRDPFTNKPYVHFYTTKRVGGGVQNPETIKILKMAAA